MKVIANEEERFHLTLADGMKMVEDKIAAAQNEGKKVISGEDAFQLYDTYGFPIDLTEDAAEEHGLTVDIPGFEQCMAEQRARSQEAGSAETGKELALVLSGLLGDVDATEFTGYTTMADEAFVKAVIIGEARTDVLSAGEEGFVAFNQTPCYAEMGGQVGDRGYITAGDAKAEILTTFKLPNGIYIHKVKGLDGSLKAGDTCQVQVAVPLRKATMRNHTATHLMHKALREVLGDHANQAGSLVTEDRLRFDFNHFSAVTPEELKEIEDRVNAEILKDTEVCTKEMDLEEAKAQGAMALFGEKYGSRVRFVDIGGWSKELCGGTHVSRVGEIGLFKIISESSIGAGLRRIEAVTGDAARGYYQQEEDKLAELSSLLKVKDDDLVNKVKGLLAELKEKDKEIAGYKQAAAEAGAQNVLENIEDFPGGKGLVADMGTMDMNGLRETADRLKEGRTDLALVLFAIDNNKVSIVVTAGKDWQAKGLQAGKLIKVIAPIVGGGGGGRPDMAQAGGKDTSKVAEAMAKAKELLGAI